MRKVTKNLTAVLLSAGMMSCTIPQTNRLAWELKQIKDGKITVFDIDGDKTMDLIVSGYHKGGEVDYSKLLFIESDNKTAEAPDGRWEERGYTFYIDKKNDLWVKSEGKSWKPSNNYFRSNITARITSNGNIDVEYNGERVPVNNNRWEMPGLKIWLDDSTRLWVQEGSDKKIIANGYWKRKFNVLVNPVNEWIKGTALKRGGKVDEKHIPIGNGIVAINGKNQKIMWLFEANDEISSYPTIYENKVYFGSKDKNVYALDLKTGKQIWKYPTSGEIFATPAVSKDTVYIGNRRGIFYALNASSGSIIWSFKTEGLGAIDSSAAVYDNKVYFGSWDKYFYALDTTSGRIAWRRKFISYIGQVSPVVAYDKVFFGCWDRNIYALDAYTGNIVWKVGTNDWIDRASPAIADGMLYIGNKNGNLYAVSTATGYLKWQFKTGDAITSSPVVTENRVYVASRDGYLYAINPERGRLLWERNTRFKIYSSPALGVNEVYLPNAGGYLYAVKDTDMGQVYWPMHGGEPSHRGYYGSAVSFGKKLVKEKTELDKFFEDIGLNFELNNKGINDR